MIRGTTEQIHYKQCVILTVTALGLHRFMSILDKMHILGVPSPWPGHPYLSRSVKTTSPAPFWAGQALSPVLWTVFHEEQLNHLNCSCLPE